MENSNLPMKITIEYEDGTSEQKEVGGIFEAKNGNTYAMLLDEKTTQSGEVEFIRLNPFESEEGKDFYIENIDSVEEYNLVVEACSNYISEVLESSSDEDGIEESEAEVLDGEKVVLTNEKGEREIWYLIRIFDLNNRNYAVMRKENEIELNIVRAYMNDTNNKALMNCRFESITSVMEYECVKEYFIENIEKLS